MTGFRDDINMINLFGMKIYIEMKRKEMIFTGWKNMSKRDKPLSYKACI